MTKWQVYPELGFIFKISFISMYCCIGLIILFSLILFILKKKNKESSLIFPLEIITYISFISTVVSRVIVELDIYHHGFLYYIIAMIILTTFIIFISRKFKAKQWIIITIMLTITLICLFTNQDTYPDDNATDVIEGNFFVKNG